MAYQAGGFVSVHQPDNYKTKPDKTNSDKIKEKQWQKKRESLSFQTDTR